MYTSTNLNRAFTLIEILVVISIIGILSSLLYVSFGSARDEARNRALQAELKEVQLAIELYKSQNGVYPTVPACGTSGAGVQTGRSTLCDNDYIAGLRPDFIADLPQEGDSANTSCDIVYKTDTSNTWYKLTAVNCHKGAAITQTDRYARCPSTCTYTAGDDCDPSAANFQNSYAVYSKGGECIK